MCEAFREVRKIQTGRTLHILTTIQVLQLIQIKSLLRYSICIHRYSVIQIVTHFPHFPLLCTDCNETMTTSLKF